MRRKNKIFPEEVRYFNLDFSKDLSQLSKQSLSACREITFQITENCNLKCDYCYECNKKEKVMTLETGKKICDLLIENINRDDGLLGRNTLKGLVLEFIGGEPLLYPELIEGIINYFFEKLYPIRPDLLPFVRISITTNGINFFNPKVHDFLKKYQSIISLTVSIDGIKELHDAHRVDSNGNGSFDKAYEAFQEAKKFNWYNSKMTFVPSSFNYISDSIVFMLQEGVKDIFCNCAYEPYYSIDDGKILYEQLKKVSDYLFQNNINDVYISFLDSDLGNKATNDSNYCGGTGNMLSFDTEGNAYPCLRYHPTSLKEKAKDIQIGDLNGIFVSPKQIKIKDYLDSITYNSQSSEECINCPISSGCGWCSAYNYQVTGDVNKRVTNICNAHKARVLAYYYYINKRCLIWGDCLPQTIKIKKSEALKFIPEEEWNSLLLLQAKAIKASKSKPR